MGEYMMKSKDYIIMAFIILFILLSFLFIKNLNKEPNKWVLIEVNSQLVEKININQLETGTVMAVDGPLGSSLIEFADGKVRMQESPCPDGICESQGWISQVGQIIVCLPNKVVIRIVEKQ